MMQRKYYIFWLITAICFSINLFTYGQSKKIEGKVTDDKGNPLAYVNVFIKDSFDGAMSEEDGTFSFFTNKKGEVILIASMIGYKKYEKKIKIDTLGKSPLNIILKKASIKTDEILITASSYGTEADNGVVMTSMDVITTPGGAADIYQSLKTLPGLTQVSESAELYVRGGDPGETITLLDQATLYHPYTFESAFGGLFSNINTKTIKGMHFSSGGFSTKYGNALSGVLELSTYNEPANRNFLLGLSLAGAEISGQIPVIYSKFGFLFNARQSFTKPIFWINGGLDDFTIVPVSSDANINLTYKYSNTGRVKLFGSVASDKQGVNVQLPGYTDVFNNTSSNYLINIQLSDIIFHNTVIKTSVSRSYYKSKWILGILDLNRNDTGMKLRVDTETISSSSLKISSGAEVENRKVNYTGIIPSNDYDYRSESSGEVINASFNVTRTGAYAEAEVLHLFGVKRFYLISGIRGDIVLPLNLKWLDPRVNLGYKVTDELTLTFGWGIFHQHPDPRLYSPTDGNPALDAMKAVHYIASVDYKFNKFENLRVEFYYKNYENLPLEDKRLNYTNNGYGFAKGVDFMIKGTLFGIIDGWISYGFIDTKRYWMDFDELSSSSFDITHNLSLVAKYNITRSLQIGVNYKYATGRPFDPVVGSKYIPELDIYEPIYGSKNSARYPTYQRLDLRITYLTRLFKKYFAVFFMEGLNILDISNIFGYSYNKDYSERFTIDSYFGRRTVVFGMQVNI